MNKTITAIILGILFSFAFISMASALTIDSVETSKTDIQPGDVVDVYLELENNLEKDADDVFVSLDLTSAPFAPFESSNSVYEEEIGEDDSEKFTFKLVASSDAESGTYKIPVNIIYSLGDENKTSVGLISLTINAQPQLEISIEGYLIKGKTGEISLNVVNSGLGEARLLGLKIIPVSGLKIIGSDSSYIGDIESDDFDNANFQISVGGSVPSAVNLPVQISYRDSKNKQFTETEYLALNVYTQEEAIEVGLIQKSNTLTYVIVVVVLIVLWLVWRAWRKARKRRA